jgi:hypothetical protein
VLLVLNRTVNPHDKPHTNPSDTWSQDGLASAFSARFP